jgi:peptidoglycan/xylan/chitin deacetylase (PgdA/CDA1 family)
VTDLFREFITDDESGFAEQLYCSASHLREMTQMGMYVGGHGNTHRRLDLLSEAEQETEIEATVALLDAVGTPTTNWIMCYPHGSYDRRLTTKLHSHGCAVGLTSRSALASLDQDDPLALPRVDTNELLAKDPLDRAAQVAEKLSAGKT